MGDPVPSEAVGEQREALRWAARYVLENVSTGYDEDVLAAAHAELGRGPSSGEWTCPHGSTYSGSPDFISGARNAHDEIKYGQSPNYGAAANQLDELNRQAVAGFCRDDIDGVARMVVDAAFPSRELRARAAERET